MREILVGLSLVGIVFSPHVVSAQFVPDEFNSTTMGTQWTWQDSTPAGSTFNLNGTHFNITAANGADTYFNQGTETYAYLEQTAPTGTNWEVITKVDGFDPSETGKRNNWNKTGIMIYQDNLHWYSVRLIGNAGAEGLWDRAIEGAYNNRYSMSAAQGEHSGDQAIWGFTNDPVWMKVQKTEHGYFGYYSLDGTNWIMINRMIRNSQNAAGGGYYTNEKIRLFQSSPGMNGVTDTGSFDFVRTGPVTVPTAAAGTNDEFNAGTLDTTVWGTHPGILASNVFMQDGKLKITPGHFNDQWGGIDKAARVYQDAPASGDWQVTVKAGPNTLFDYQDWSGYGVMLWQDQNDYVFLSNVRTNGGEHMIQAVYQFNDSLGWFVNEINIGGTLLPEYLRVKKVGSTYTACYSYDNVTFTELAPGGHNYGAELLNPQVQLVGKKINSAGGVQMTVEFDWVHFESLGSAVADWTVY